MKQSNNNKTIKQSNNNVLSFESQFPPDFRKDDIKRLLSLVLSGKFCQLISLPGGGKATLLKILARNKNIRTFHLGEKEKSVRFVYLNLLELDNLDQPSIDEFLLHSLKPDAKHSSDPFILSKQLTDTVNKLTAQVTLILLFDHFDEIQNKLTRSFFQRLRTVKSNARYKFDCVFATRRDLRQLVDPEIRREFYDFFAANTVYMNLYDEKAVNFLFTQIEEALGKLSLNQKNAIVSLTSGHAKLTRVCAETVLHGIPIEKEILLTKPLVRAALFELWLFLTAEEQHVLTQIVKKNPAPQSESTENLISFGLIKQFNNSTIKQSSFSFTIPLFEQFVRTNANTLHREKISYRKDTKEIKKGEEIISDLLSQQENRLLRFLIENQGRIVERDEIISTVWPHAQIAEAISDEAIDQMVFRLRKKIEDEPKNPRHITTVKGRGFRFQP